MLSLKCEYPLNRGATKVGFHWSLKSLVSRQRMLEHSSPFPKKIDVLKIRKGHDWWAGSGGPEYEEDYVVEKEGNDGEWNVALKRKFWNGMMIRILISRLPDAYRIENLKIFLINDTISMRVFGRDISDAQSECIDFEAGRRGERGICAVFIGRKPCLIFSLLLP